VTTSPLPAAFSNHVHHVAVNARADFGQALAHGVAAFDRRTAILLAAITVAAIALAAFLVGRSGPEVVFFQEQASLYQISDTRFRRLFYTLFVGLGFAVFLAVGLLRPAARLSSNEPSTSLLERMEKLWPVVLVCFLVAVSLRLRLGDLLAALLLVYLVTQALDGHIKTRTLAIATALAAVLLYVVPFAFTHLVKAGDLWTMDTHWTAVFGPALFEDPFSQAAAWKAITSYGVLMNMAIAAINETFFGGSTGGAITSLKLFNVVFAALVFIIIGQRFLWTNRRLIVLGSLIVLLLFSPMAANVARTFETANQLPIRFLCIPIAIALAPRLARMANLPS